MKSFSFVLFIVFLNLERTSDLVFLKFVSFLSLSIYIFGNYLLKRKIKFFKIPKLMYIFILMILFGVARSSDPNSSILSEINKFLVFFLSIFAFVQALSISLFKGYSSQKVFIWVLFLPLLGLIFFNLLGFLLGLSSNATEGTDLGNAVILGKLGFNLKRVSFPFSTGFNTYSSIVGVLLLFSIFGFKFFRGYKYLMTFGFVLSSFTLLLIDTRSAFLYPFLVFFLFLIVFDKNRLPKFLWLIPLMLFYGPILLTWVLSIIGQISALSFLSRSSEDFVTANSRTIIWFMASLEFLEFKLIHLFGFGEQGHFSSGASQLWSDIFVQWGDSSLFITPHSNFYSILYDYGYLGLIFVLFLQFKVFNLMKFNFKGQPYVFAILIAFLLYWNLVGVVETFFGFYTPNALIIFSMVVIFAYFINKQLRINRKFKRNDFIVK